MDNFSVTCFVAEKLATKQSTPNLPFTLALCVNDKDRSMKEKEMDRWKTLRTKGKRRYIIENGVLGWGMPMFVFMAFINTPFSEGFLTKNAIVHYVVWPLGGLFFGLCTWYFAEKRYNKALEKVGSES